MAIINSPATADSPRFHQMAQFNANAGRSPPSSAAGTFGAWSPQMRIPGPAGVEHEPDNGRKVGLVLLKYFGPC